MTFSSSLVVDCVCGGVGWLKGEVGGMRMCTEKDSGFQYHPSGGLCEEDYAKNIFLFLLTM